MQKANKPYCETDYCLLGSEVFIKLSQLGLAADGTENELAVMLENLIEILPDLYKLRKLRGKCYDR